MDNNLKQVDHNAIRTSQAAIISLNILAFLFDLPVLALVVALTMIAGTLLKTPGFAWIYLGLLLPMGLARPDLRLDNSEPHRFAQGLGGLLMLIGGAALFGGLPLPGWGLVWLVTALAALNLFAGFCVGCMAYYWLGRLNIPGFHKPPPAGATPGMRSKIKVPYEP